MTQTLVSVDLDWLNGSNRPIDKLRRLLKHIPNNVPSVITIQHHQFLPHLRRWIKQGRVPTPFNFLSIDEHHDFYLHKPPYDPIGKATDCSNWGYRMPKDCFRRLTWVRNSSSYNIDWGHTQKWLKERNIVSSSRNQHLLSRLKSPVVAAVFCVSPDYLHGNVLDCIQDAVEIVACHFNMGKAPERINSRSPVLVNGWKIAPRPVRIQ